MTLHEPERGNEREMVDSGMPLRDSERSRAGSLQISVTAIAIAAILLLFFWGVNNQREENGGSETAAQPMPATVTSAGTSGAQSSQSKAPETTGQAPNQPAAPPANQQPTGTGQNATPAQGDQPAQPRGAGK